MQEFIQNIGFLQAQVLWGVTLWQLLLATVIIFLGFVSRRIIMLVAKGMLSKRAAENNMVWDDDFLELIPSPLAAIAQIGLWHMAAGVLQIPSEPINIELYVFQGLEVALLMSVLWLTLRLIDVVFAVLGRASHQTESPLDDQLIPLLRKTFKMIVAIAIIIMVVQNLGYSVTSLLASLGIGGLALALAAQDTVANVFGSVVIFTDRPFKLGDWVEFDGVEGTVEEVGFRTTRIRRFDKSLVTVPNQKFSTTSITNHSLRPIRRIKMTVGVTYETDAGQMEALLNALRALLKAHPALDQNFHFAHFVGFGSSSLDVQIYCFTKSTAWVDFLNAQETLMLQIMHTVAEHGLEMAFPTRTVYMRDEHWKAEVSQITSNTQQESAA